MTLPYEELPEDAQAAADECVRSGEAVLLTDEHGVGYAMMVPLSESQPETGKS